MRTIQLLPYAIFLTFLVACNSEGDKTETDPSSKNITPEPVTPAIFEQMVGTWQNDETRSIERWSKMDNGSYKTESFKVIGSDTTWIETGTVYPESTNWVFENTVVGQNDGKAVKFTTSSISGTSVQFSNPAHDFPTDVNYTMTDPKKVHAFIVGPNEKGGKDTIHFNFTKIQ
jgi:hypothetical protein